MTSKPFITAALIFIVILQSARQGVLAAESRPQEKFKIIGLSLLSPAGDGWHHKAVHPARIEFAKLGSNDRESFVALAVLHKLPETESDDEFLRKVSDGRWGEDQNQTRFKTLLNEEKITHEKDTLCIRYHTKYEDHGSRHLTEEIPYFIVEDIGLICRHPGNSKIGVSIGFSQRVAPENLLADFNKLANVFLANSDFEPLPDGL